MGYYLISVLLKCSLFLCTSNNGDLGLIYWYSAEVKHFSHFRWRGWFFFLKGGSVFQNLLSVLCNLGDRMVELWHAQYGHRICWLQWGFFWAKGDVTASGQLHHWVVPFRNSKSEKNFVPLMRVFLQTLLHVDYSNKLYRFCIYFYRETREGSCI